MKKVLFLLLIMSNITLLAESLSIEDCLSNSLILLEKYIPHEKNIIKKYKLSSLLPDVYIHLSYENSTSIYNYFKFNQFSYSNSDGVIIEPDTKTFSKYTDRTWGVYISLSWYVDNLIFFKTPFIFQSKFKDLKKFKLNYLKQIVNIYFLK